MDMKHNFSMYFRCNDCESLYYAEYWENKDLVEKLMEKMNEKEKDWGKIVGPYLPKCMCGSNLKYYENQCPQCKESFEKAKFRVINCVKDKHEIKKIKLSFDNGV